jgi:KDO2-lipid IV(A) lauroyltransferase
MLIALLRLIGRIPLKRLHAFGAALGWLVYWLVPAYARRLRQNLRASGVCSSPEKYRSLLRSVIKETGKAGAEGVKIWFGADQEVERLMIECRGWDQVETARSRGRGIIFLAPHLGCFELAALYVARRLPLTVLYRSPKYRSLEPLFTAGRARWQMKLAPAKLKGVRMLYRALERGEAVGLLPDQAPTLGGGAWAEFFGRPAYTMTLPRKLQRASGAAVIMAFAERLPDGRGYRLLLDSLGTEDLTEERLNQAIEALVRRHPEQYLLWGYNRYKKVSSRRSRGTYVSRRERR